MGKRIERKWLRRNVKRERKAQKEEKKEISEGETGLR